MKPRAVIQSLRAASWRKSVLLASALLLALLAALVAIPRLVDLNTYRGQIAGQLEQRLGRTVKLGTLQLSLLPSIKIKVDELAIGEDPKVDQGEFVRAQAVQLQPNLLSLLRGQPQVKGIQLLEPAVTLIKTGVGQWNWSTLKPLQSSATNAEQFPFDLLVQNGRFTLIDRTVTPVVEKNFSGVNMTLDDFSPRQAFDFTVALTLPGAQTGALVLAGTTGPFDAGATTRAPIKARAHLESVEISSLAALLDTASTLDGRLTLDAELAGKLAEGLQVEGDLKAEQLRLNNTTEPLSLPLAADFKLTATAQEQATQTEFALQLAYCELQLGQTRADISGQITRLPTQPALDLQIKGERMALGSLLESAHAFGFGPPGGTKANGIATFNLRATGALPAIALNGQAELRDLILQGGVLPQALHITELKLNCQPQAITATPFRATLATTAVEFSAFTLSNYQQQPRAHLEIATVNAQLEELLKIAAAFGFNTSLTGSGTATLKAALDTNLNAAQSGLTVNGQGYLSNAKLQSTQLKQPLEIAQTQLGFSGNSFRVDNLRARFGQSQLNGWLQVKDFDQPAASFELNADQLDTAAMQQAFAGTESAAGSPTAKLRTTGQISIGKLLASGLTATDVRGKALLQNQSFSLDPLSLKLYGGAYQGAVHLNLASNAPEIALQGRFDKLDINQFLSAAGQQSMLYGQANGSINVRGRGNGAEGVAKSLVGTGAIAISNGKFASFDLARQVEVLGKLYKLPTGGVGTAFRSLKTNLKFERGRLFTDTLQIVMDDMQVSGDGSLVLGEPTLADYELLVRLSQRLTQQVMPGSSSGEKSANPADELLRLGGRVMAQAGTFFVDQAGLAVPLKMTGPLKNPSFSLNTAILERRAKEQLQERIAKPMTKKPDDVLKGVLDIFKRKDKKP